MVFKVKRVPGTGYQIYWASEERNPVPLAFEWDKIYTGSSGQSNAYRRARQLNTLVAIQERLLAVGAGWWAGPYKAGKGKGGKYYIHPDRDEPREEDLLGFTTLEQLVSWIEESEKQRSK